MLLRKILLAASILVGSASATTYTENFDDPLKDWRDRWLYQNTNLESWYYAFGWNCNTNYRGNKYEGIYYSDDQGACGILQELNPVTISFKNDFGARATKFSIGIMTPVQDTDVTFRIYDRNGKEYSSVVLETSYFYDKYSWDLTNGISAFEWDGGRANGTGSEGNGSINDVELEIPERCDLFIKVASPKEAVYGDTLKVTTTVCNPCTTTAAFTRGTLDVSGPGELHYDIEQGSNIKAGDSLSVEFSYLVPEKADCGTYNIEFGVFRADTLIDSSSCEVFLEH